MECKEGFPLRFADSSLSINRNIVECKVCKKKCLNMLFLLVLIETLWNVKIWESQGYSVTRLVLIETLWNVKFLRSDTMSITNVGINRNIVECKDAYSGVNWCGCLPRINRNIVECKVEHGDIIIRSIPGINRNIVECKEMLKFTFWLVPVGINRNIVECKDREPVRL